MLKNKGFFLIITATGGVLIILNPFLPYWAGESGTALELAKAEPGNLAALSFLYLAILGAFVVILSVSIKITKGGLRNLCWGLGLALVVFAFLSSILEWLLVRYQPFAAPGFTKVPGIGIYSSLLGSLLALAGLILYKFWR